MTRTADARPDADADADARVVGTVPRLLTGDR